MRYVAAYTDLKSGEIKFKPFDYLNDALEFLQSYKDKELWTALYKEMYSNEYKRIQKP